MSERKLKTPALEISMHSPQPDYAQILEQLYHLRGHGTDQRRKRAKLGHLHASCRRTHKAGTMSGSG